MNEHVGPATSIHGSSDGVLITSHDYGGRGPTIISVMRLVSMGDTGILSVSNCAMIFIAYLLTLGVMVIVLYPWAPP